LAAGNLKVTTAKALGLTILEPFLLPADDIEREAAGYLRHCRKRAVPSSRPRGAHNHLVLFD
jgi:hypothetical protein